MLSSCFWCPSHPHVCCCHLLLSRQSLQPLQAEYARQEPGESDQEDIEMHLGEIDEVHNTENLIHSLLFSQA